MTDFAPGDVVVCVDVGPSVFDPRATKLLKQGASYRVNTCGEWKGVACVAFRDFPSDTPGHAWAFKADRFRRLCAADEQFTEQMRALRPAKVPATLSRSSENRNG